MTVAALVLYALSAALELAGVVLVVLEVRRSRQLWAMHSQAVEQERQRRANDLRYAIDPLTTRYGLTAGEIRRAVATVAQLVDVDRRRQSLAVLLLVAGILAGLAGNVVGQLA